MGSGPRTLEFFFITVTFVNVIKSICTVKITRFVGLFYGLKTAKSDCKSVKCSTVKGYR